MKLRKFWKYKYSGSIYGIEIADINGNGKEEIIAYSKTGVLIVISQNGKLLYHRIISKNSPIWHSKIYDIDNDGKNELILGGMDGILRIFKCDLKYNLKSLWNHKFDSSISGILIDDINNDNIDELIVFSLDKSLRVLNPLNGDLIWGQVFEDGIGDAIIFIDTKNNSKKEIIACGNDGTIRCFDGIDGSLLWFKTFSNKVRCVSFLNSVKGIVLLVGGDDKVLHILDKATQKEFKIIKFKDFVWKCISYPKCVFNNAIISSYSFDYFKNLIAIEKVKFTSKIICLNEIFEVKWELKGYNCEFIKIIKFQEKLFILLGTTKGELLIVDPEIGKILFKIQHDSCINMIQFLEEQRIIINCYDDGSIYAYNLEDF
ncbi:MAG: hypothetical protein ACFE9I_04950 [Candidatus Hermodarchaeota archaeon]